MTGSTKHKFFMIRNQHKLFCTLFFVFIISIVLLSPIMIFAQETNPDLIEAKKSIKSITIDGQWTTQNEWITNEAILLVDESGNENAYLIASHDEEYSYFLIDFVSDVSEHEDDRGSIGLGDVQHKGNVFRDSDHWFTTKPAVYEGNNLDEREFRKSWKEISLGSNNEIASGFNSINNPFSDSPHRIYEFKISKKFIDGNNDYLLYVSAQNVNTKAVVRWPQFVNLLHYEDALGMHHPPYTDDWGILHLSNELQISQDISKKTNGCLIATAAFGTELAPQVQLLREVRDGVLYSTGAGTTFMTGFNEFYYAFSPALADLERQSPLFKEVVKTTITPMLSTISILNYANIDSEQEMLGYGIGVILLNISVYFVTPMLIIFKLKQKFDEM